MQNLFFTNNSLPNFHLEVNAHGAKVWVSLNIEPNMKKYLSPNNVFKANKLYVFALRKQIEVVNVMTIKSTHEELLNKAMITCRMAKQKVLESEITLLKQQSK
jgi:hypothetical protein